MQRAWRHINKYQSVAGPALKPADEIIVDKYFIIIIIIIIYIIIIITIIINSPFYNTYGEFRCIFYEDIKAKMSHK